MAHSAKRASASRYWCYTLNNYTSEEYDDCVHAWVDSALLTYTIVGKETGDEGTKHLQGYCQFRKRTRLSGVRKLFPRAHWTRCDGTPEENITYCSKEHDWIECGTRPVSTSQRNKRDWDAAFASAKKGDFDAIPKNMLVRYYHAFKRIRQDNPDVLEDMKSHRNYWIVAPSGHGKSVYARKRWTDLYDKAPNKWWIGYKGQENVLLDDMDFCTLQYLKWYLKRWADIFPFPAETKGGGMMIRPRRIIITTQSTIDECYPIDYKMQAAIRRRFKIIKLAHWKQRIH